MIARPRPRQAVWYWLTHLGNSPKKQKNIFKVWMSSVKKNWGLLDTAAPLTNKTCKVVFEDIFTNLHSSNWWHLYISKIFAGTQRSLHGARAQSFLLDFFLQRALDLQPLFPTLVTRKGRRGRRFSKNNAKLIDQCFWKFLKQFLDIRNLLWEG